MKFSVKFTMARDLYDRNIYIEAAKRVVFRNCMNQLELDDKSLPNFNRDFYYNKEELKQSLDLCYNSRMAAHFGVDNALQRQGIAMNFEHMMREYQEYEYMHPMKKHLDPYLKGKDEEDI